MKSNHNVEHISMLTPDTIKESVMKRHEELSSILSNIHSRISHAPDGSLRTAQKANGCQYYHKVKVGDTKGKYIKKNNYNLAIKLAQKDYDLKVETCLIKELDFLQRILDQYRPDKIQHIYDSLNNSRKQIVTPVYVSDEEFIADWKSLEYTSLGFSPDYAEYYTDNGERVRSKSEIIIANKLYRYNIPYRYVLCNCNLGSLLILTLPALMSVQDRNTYGSTSVLWIMQNMPAMPSEKLMTMQIQVTF